MVLTKRAFAVFGMSLANHIQPSTAIATSRAGHVGVLDLEFGDPSCVATRNAVERLAVAGRGDWGLKLRVSDADTLFSAVGSSVSGMGVAVFVLDDVNALDGAMAALRAVAPNAQAFAELHDADHLAVVEKAGLSGVIAKGHEAGGAVGDETTLLLTQRLVALTKLPVIAHGGVGPNTAAALKVAGAAGVVLDWQLALFDEAATPQKLAMAISRMDGSETRTLGGDLGHAHRVFWRADHKAAHALEALDIPGSDAGAFLAAVDKAVDPTDAENSVWLVGQDAAFARRFADTYSTLGKALDAIADSAAKLTQLAQELKPLAEGSPLAQATGTRYPIIQGPMTRVSDTSDFAVAVAKGGALPFLALALMRKAEVAALLEETKAKVGDMPWGVGILGFVDDALREEQTALIVEHKPDYALIAGGRPDQALALEAQGIPTFLHVPSPGLLSLFLESGARRFIFEGRECGGHVGPRSSSVLWQQAVDALLDHYGPEGEIDCELLFAGGVHDERSGAMVSALAAGLAARGAKIGVIVGTGYILTKEAVEAGAVLETYQKLALESKRTMLLESGPGHATRVVESPIVDEFFEEKARLRSENIDPDDIKDQLEHFNVGRSRIASKGVDRNPDYGKVDGAKKFVKVKKADQMKKGVYMIGQVANLHDTPTTIADLHAAICTGSAAVLDAAVPAPEPVEPFVEGPGSRIAITGFGTILPKAQDFTTYWENILDRVDAIEEVPERRWDWRRYYDENRDAPDKMYSKWGGFLDEIEFDPIKYGIPPNSMPAIEPLQLLALETVRQALENAGFKDGVIEDEALRRKTSVIIGVGGGAGPLGQRYAVRSSLPAINGSMPETAEERLPEWTEDSFPGILLNVIAGRVANRFDLGGVNFTVDAACGSSLAAVMMAARELENETSDMVIVGGADSFQNPFDFLAFSKTRALSPRGRCRTFDAGADGIAISEGLAMMVLRRLDQAEAEGDRIYAVLRGVAGSSDGKDLSLTAPRPEGQESALVRAYDRAGISPSTVGLVEAHGTGTVVGDRTEIQSLSKMFADYSDEKQFCGVGSVKSMIGHTKAAAGCAGMIKMALALHHRVLPSTLNVEEPNPGANFPESPFYVATEARPWMRRGDTPRRAGVSAFGFGGTNFHAVLEEYRGGYLPKHQDKFRKNWTHELYLFSANSKSDLTNELRRASDALSAAPEGVSAKDIAASLAKKFDAKATARFGLVATSLADASARLARAAETIDGGDDTLRAVDPSGAYFSADDALTNDQVAFLFPGQGSQYPGMVSDLATTFPSFHDTLEGASHALDGRTPAPLADLIFPRPTLDEDEKAAQVEALKRTDVAQPAIGAVSVAVLQLLKSFGLDAVSAAGHSFGEFSALYSAGTFDADTLLSLAHARGDAIMKAGGDDLGAMAAVNAGPDAVRAALSADAGVTLANINAPDQTVIAGPTPAIAAAEEALKAAGFAAKRLPVACGFHSDCVAPARDLLAQALESAEISAPDRPVYANATAAPYPDGPAAVRAQLAQHLIEPVNFVGSVEQMHDAGARLFLEVGPGSVLTALTDRILGDKPHLALPADKKGRSGVQQILCLLAGAATAGLDLSMASVFDGRADDTLDVTGWNLAPAEDSRRAMLWKVDAANSRPINGTPQRRGFAARIEEDPKTVTNQRPIASPTPTAEATAPATTAPAPNAAPASVPRMAATPAGSGADEIMRRHQELMTQFLENNRAVMMQWMGAAPTAARPAMPAPAPVAAAPVVQPAAVAPVMPVETPPVVQPVPAPARVAQAPEATSSVSLTADAATDALLALISDRTGYPTDMLDLDLNLEADLGIDSIKRVEILGALRGDLLPNAGEEARERIGPVSRERTVRGIVAKFMEVAGDFAAPTPVAAAANAPAAPTGPNLSEPAVTDALLALISDRTGYPTDMLDLDLNLEADLGIDSIKRVEILGALRGDLLPNAGEEARERMGPVSRERTVRGIVAKFMEVAGDFAAPTPVAAAANAPAAPTGPNLSEPAVTDALLALISDRTGYPTDMLDLDLNLEADLGIDSIKRVEILGALRGDLLPNAGEEARERMGPVSRERTVRGIVAKFMEVAGDFAAPTPVAAAANAPAAPTGPNLSEGAVTDALLALISDRTGYPTDMLDLDLNLEADLGIDSIKRVEILGALRGDLLPNAGEEARERMGPVSRERTVRGIVAKFMEVAGDFAGTPSVAPVEVVVAQGEAEPEVSADDWGARFVMIPLPVPAPERAEWLTQGATYVITDDGAGVAAGLADAISAKGGKPLLLNGADLSDDQALRDLVAAEASKIAGLFHCAPLRGVPKFAEMSRQEWDGAVDASTRALYSLLSGLGGSLSTRADAVVVAASAMGGAFGFDSVVPQSPAAAGAPGLLKTIAKEWDDALVRSVDFDVASDTSKRVEVLLAEAGHRDDHVEIGVRGDERLGLFAEQRSISADALADIELDKDSVVLVTGGARGITAKIVKHLASNHSPRFVLLGSSPAPEGPEDASTAGITDARDLKSALIAATKAAGQPVNPAAIEGAYRAVIKAREIRDAIAVVEAAGSQVEYLACDVRDDQGLTALINGVYDRYGRIDGVLHGAGVIEDKLLLDKDVESFDKVIRTKTESAFTLAKALRPDGLKFLVFFTSVAGRFGNRGQGDYGAANETVSKLARVLNADWPTSVTAVSWGPWDSGGMVSDEIKAQFNAMKIEPIAPVHGVRALELEITRGSSDEPEVVWGRGPWEEDTTRFAETYGGPRTREAAE
ncbi:type I polyketide synthase [Actibacterium lipolyticum]|uniref:Phenolphthiocerol synthesis polyketide synthase type I Pks15/1 n=1 Tax=Actibacterium lipolyticum TaxID=1524263 RepID=A0A238JVP4_9RHOB|nr:type I polyketide synthase [Actibacterium lipolyticum]SMX34720.1 Phenolphthiocerol synthesis polyketide synthase type I Pks15/1 [Actibacterium lipolyticum]